MRQCQKPSPIEDVEQRISATTGTNFMRQLTILWMSRLADIPFDRSCLLFSGPRRGAGEIARDGPPLGSLKPIASWMRWIK